MSENLAVQSKFDPKNVSGSIAEDKKKTC